MLTHYRPWYPTDTAYAFHIEITLCVMNVTEITRGAAWRNDSSRAAELTSFSAPSPMLRSAPRKHFTSLHDSIRERQDWHGISPLACLALSSRPQAMPLPPEEPLSTRTDRKPNAARASPSRKSAVGKNAPRRRAPCGGADDADLWVEDVTSTSNVRARGNSSDSSSLLSGLTGPLTPATARALARSFGRGELALASAGPLQVRSTDI